MDTIIDSKNRFHGISSEHRVCYLRVLALRKHIETAEAPLVAAFIGGGSGDLYNPMNNLSDPLCLARAAVTTELVGANFALALLEGSEVFKEAEGFMVPAFAQIAEDNRQIAERVAAEGEANRVAAEAVERATAKALAAAEKDPAVVKARAALAALNGTPAPAPVGFDSAELASDAAELLADFK